MTKRKTNWSALTTAELTDATKSFDDPNYHPPAVRPSRGELASLRRVRRKAAADRFSIALALDKKLIDEADQYALAHGITFSDLVADALRRVVGKKSA